MPYKTIERRKEYQREYWERRGQQLLAERARQAAGQAHASPDGHPAPAQAARADTEKRPRPGSAGAVET